MWRAPAMQRLRESVLLVVTVAGASGLALFAGLRSFLREPEPPGPHDTKHLLEDIRASRPAHAILRGHVRWSDGSPTKGATIHLTPSHDSTLLIPPQSASTDADGFFRI